MDTKPSLIKKLKSTRRANKTHMVELTRGRLSSCVSYAQEICRAPSGDFLKQILCLFSYFRDPSIPGLRTSRRDNPGDSSALVFQSCWIIQHPGTHQTYKTHVVTRSHS